VAQSWFGYSPTAAPRNTPHTCKSHHNIIPATIKPPRWDVSRTKPTFQYCTSKSKGL
jgi:hypothetical protein